MKVSLAWLSDFIDVTPLRENLSEILHKLTMRGLEVEGVQNLAQGFANVVTAQVVEKNQHPDATKLSLCQVSDGAKNYQIVCGAQNFKTGDKVILSKEGAHLPNGMKIIASEIRGVKSFGMLCSEVELGLATESPGIMILPSDTPLGVPAATFLGRDDVVFEINVTPNRGDALSIVGVARELASILNQPWDFSLGSALDKKFPTFKPGIAKDSAASSVKIKSIQIADEKLCLQYHGFLLEGVKVGPSPAWLVKRLEAMGQRSISNVVDLTNYVMLEWGTPLHAFDAEKLTGFPNLEIKVRNAVPEEKFKLLDDTQIECQGSELLITDGALPVALAGVMGGLDSEVSATTKTVFLEAAQFDASVVRQTARKFQKHSEASHRFERMIDPQAVLRGAHRAVELFQQLAGAKLTAGPVSCGASVASSQEVKSIPLFLSRLQKLLGVNLSVEEVTAALNKVGFLEISTTQAGGDSLLQVKPLSFRPDVQNPEDLAEEILRVIGFDHVVARLPMNVKPQREVTETLQAKRASLTNKVREFLSSQGFHECINFAFASHPVVQKWASNAQEDSAIVSLKNPLSEEFQSLRTSLLSGLFENVLFAWRHQETEVRLFEIRPVFLRDESCEQGVREEWRLAIMATGRNFSSALKSNDDAFDFYSMKGVLEGLLESLNVRGLRFQAPTAASTADTRFHPYQCVTTVLGRGPCGTLGRIHPVREQAEKLRQPLYAVEISLDRIFEMVKGERKASVPSKFPKVPRDFSFIVPKDVFAEKVISTIQKHGKPFIEGLQIVDVYAGEKIPNGMRSLSVSLFFADANRTLEESEIEAASAKILRGLDAELGVKLRTT